MTITVKELYEWAKSKGYENFDLGCTIIDTEHDDIIDVKYPEADTKNLENGDVKVIPESKDLLLQIYVRF